MSITELAAIIALWVFAAAVMGVLIRSIRKRSEGEWVIHGYDEKGDPVVIFEKPRR